MSSKEIDCICYIYVIGKDTPNKLKLSQMFGKKDTGDGNSERIENSYYSKRKYIIRNIPEGSEYEITKDEEADSNTFFYVYNVDDRETFEKFEKTQQKIKEKFFKRHDCFVLYGINCNIENKRSVSQEELMKTAIKNKCCCFELHEFKMYEISIQITDSAVFSGETIYISGSKESKYEEFLNKYTEKLLNKYEFLDAIYIPIKIEEMEPLEEILDKAIEEENSIGINFVYSPFNRNTFTSIKEYISKCSNLQNYYHLPIYIHENALIEARGETKEVSVFEAKIFCLKKRIKFSKQFAFEASSILFKIENSEGEIFVDTNDYNIDNCNLVKNGTLKVKQEYNGARICIVDLSKDYLYFNLNVDDNNYIIAGDSSNVKESQMKEKENMIFKGKKNKKQESITLHSRKMKLKVF